jgi:hypothetical protein
LALFVNAQHDGMRRWGDVEPDDIAQLGDKQVQYANSMRNSRGFNKTGAQLGDHPSTAYANLIASDFHSAVKSGDARCKDVVHLYDSFDDRIVFRNVALPCLDQNIVVSKIKVEYWMLGRLTHGSE